MSWVHTALGEKSYLSSRVWRPDLLERQLRLGLEQGAHTSMPLMRKFYSLLSCLDELRSEKSGLRFVLEPPGEGEENAVLRLSKALDSDPRRSLCMAIGPERGWTQAELRTLGAECFLPLGLGPGLVRTETAAIIAGGMALLCAGGGE